MPRGGLISVPSIKQAIVPLCLGDVMRWGAFIIIIEKVWPVTGPAQMISLIPARVS
jgi:hypothetical protein